MISVGDGNTITTYDILHNLISLNLIILLSEYSPQLPTRITHQLMLSVARSQLSSVARQLV